MAWNGPIPPPVGPPALQGSAPDGPKREYPACPRAGVLPHSSGPAVRLFSFLDSWAGAVRNAPDAERPSGELKKAWWRHRVFTAAFRQHPERFVRKPPRPTQLPPCRQDQPSQARAAGARRNSLKFCGHALRGSGAGAEPVSTWRTLRPVPWRSTPTPIMPVAGSARWRCPS